MRNFTIEQSEVELESNFAPRLWSLVHDVPALYEALLHELGNAGLSSADLRPDAGNGSVGSTGLALRLFGGKVNARMSLDRLYFRASLFAPELASAVDGVTTSIRRVLSEFRFSTHTVSYACHGPIEGIDPAEFVREFVPRPPAVDGALGITLAREPPSTSVVRRAPPELPAKAFAGSGLTLVHGCNRIDHSSAPGQGSCPGGAQAD